MIEFPLTRPNRVALARAFAPVPRVDISIECALEDQMGTAYVEALPNPRVYMIQQDQFFCYLAGDLTTDTGRDFLNQLPSNRFLMAGPPGWQAAPQGLFGDRLRAVTRNSHSSETLSLDRLTELAVNSPHAGSIRRVDAALAATETPYLSLGAFDSAEDFEQRGIGYCLVRDDQILGGCVLVAGQR